MEKRFRKIQSTNRRSCDFENLRNLASYFKEADTREGVEEVLALLSPYYRNTIRSWYPLGNDEDPNSWGNRIAAALSALKVPPRHDDLDEFNECLDLQTLDLELLRIERLDKLIEGTIKRLVATKSVKDLLGRHPPKLTNPPAQDALPVAET